MSPEVGGFDWDTGNYGKCRKHGLSLAEIESVFAAGVIILPDRKHSSRLEQRFRAIGRSNRDRYVFVVFTLRRRQGVQMIRPISARYMHKKEIQQYEKAYPDLPLG